MTLSEHLAVILFACRDNRDVAMASNASETTWSRIYQLYWRVTLVLIPSMAPALYFGGWALRAATLSFGLSLALLFPLRKRIPRTAVLLHVSIAYLTAIVQLVLPASAVISVLPPTTWRPALAIFATIGIYSLGMYGGWRSIIVAFVAALVVFSDHLVAGLPILIGLALGAVAGVAVRTVIIELAESRDRLSQHALTDPLTGLGNRRAMEQEYNRYLAVARRESVSLFVSLWDLDNLKRINDLEGHAQGDVALLSFADVLRSVLREGDALFRIGGDEFCGLHLGLKDGASIVDRVHEVFESVSVGFAECTELDLDEALARVDVLMYEHKRHRRRGPGEASPICE